MIITHKTQDGFICAYFEWHIVNEQGTVTKEGLYMYVADLWVHRDYDGEEAIERFIGMLDRDERNKNIKYIYWKRTKANTSRISRAFPRATCLRRFIKLIRRTQCLV